MVQYLRRPNQPPQGFRKRVKKLKIAKMAVFWLFLDLFKTTPGLVTRCWGAATLPAMARNILK
jgi:hypothetical protein